MSYSRFKTPVFRFGAATVASSGIMAIYLSKDEGTQRSVKFWFNLISDDYALKWYDRLHERFTDRVKQLTYELKGFYLKQAQLMSTQDDFVPAAYMRWLKDTQDRVPSEFPHKTARIYVAKLCEDELNLKFNDLFEWWDDSPLGVASIGQVHKAMLKATKQIVAVKFQNPGIEKKFRADIATLKSFAELAMPQHASAFREIEKQFTTEFDYSREGYSLYLAHTKSLPRWKDKIVIPKPHLDLCSKSILVMDYLDGVRLVDGIKEQYARLAAIQGKTLSDLEKERRAAVASGTYTLKSIEEEKWEVYRTKWALFAHDLWQHNFRRFVYNTLNPASWVYGPAPYIWTEMPIDLGQTLELLSSFQASNIFTDGIFNADAHPGNILLLRDGKLGLIDYGQMKHMSLEHRIIYAKMIIALARNDKPEVVRLYFDELGTKTKYRNEDVAFKLATFYNDRDSPDVIGEHNMATFIDFCQTQDPMVQIAEDYIFASRANIMLRGMGKAFGLQLRISNMWRREAEAFLKSQNITY